MEIDMKNKTPNCRRCKVPMKESTALQNTPTGLPDFPGDAVVTMSADGPAEIVPCWKCPQCGHSITI